MASFYFFTAGCNPLAEKPGSTKLSFYTPIDLNIGLDRVSSDYPYHLTEKPEKSFWPIQYIPNKQILTHLQYPPGK